MKLLGQKLMAVRHRPRTDGGSMPRLRPTDRRTPSPHRYPQPLHRPRHPHHADRRLTSGGEREPQTFRRFMQQRPPDPIRRAISRTPRPFALSRAISSRSANDRYRPDGGGAPRAGCVGGMPPASRNHRDPTGRGIPASTAASSLERPAAIARQNSRRSSSSATPGLPGDRSHALNLQPEASPRPAIANPPRAKHCDNRSKPPNTCP